MIERDSEQWFEFIAKLIKSKQKSNKDVFCVKCWRIFRYEDNIKHKEELPDHTKSVLTSKYYATEKRFISLARALKKVQKLENKEYYENPYQPREQKMLCKSDSKCDMTTREDSYPSIIHLESLTPSKNISQRTSDSLSIDSKDSQIADLLSQIVELNTRVRVMADTIQNMTSE